MLRLEIIPGLRPERQQSQSTFRRQLADYDAHRPGTIFSEPDCI
jgi:hypothetical protein